MGMPIRRNSRVRRRREDGDVNIRTLAWKVEKEINRRKKDFLFWPQIPRQTCLEVMRNITMQRFLLVLMLLQLKRDRLFWRLEITQRGSCKQYAGRFMHQVALPGLARGQSGPQGGDKIRPHKARSSSMVYQSCSDIAVGGAERDVMVRWGSWLT